MRFLIIFLIPALVASITDYATCDNDKTFNLLCFDDTDCTGSGFTGAKCTITGGAPSAGAQGCCTGGTADTTTTTTAASAAGGVVTTVCLDRLNPRTGISDCPASASLCKNAVYRNFMTIQCPKTCGYCTSTSSSSSSSSSTSCVDRLNPRTGVSDCPNRRAFCTNTIYRSLMQIQCPLTCGFCTSG